MGLMMSHVARLTEKYTCVHYSNSTCNELLNTSLHVLFYHLASDSITILKEYKVQIVRGLNSSDSSSPFQTLIISNRYTSLIIMALYCII